jgi:hypothetical protein
MGKMKEVFALHQQELDDFNKYYSHLYDVANSLNVKQDFYDLYKSAIKINTKTKKNKNGK